MTDIECVRQLIVKAAKSEKPDDAMKFAQAALNAVNAIAQVGYIEQTFPGKRPTRHRPRTGTISLHRSRSSPVLTDLSSRKTQLAPRRLQTLRGFSFWPFCPTTDGTQRGCGQCLIRPSMM